MENNLFEINHIKNFSIKIFIKNFNYIIKRDKFLINILKTHTNLLVELSKVKKEIIDLFVDLYFSPGTYIELKEFIQKYFDELIKNDELKTYLINSIKTTINFYLFNDNEAIDLIRKYSNEMNDNFNDLKLNFLADLVNLRKNEIIKKYKINKYSNLYKFLVSFYELCNMEKENISNFEEKIVSFYNTYLINILKNFSKNLDNESLEFIKLIFKIYSNSMNATKYLKEILEKLTDLNNNYILIKTISETIANKELKSELIQKVKNICLNLFKNSENKIKDLWLKYIDYIENVEIINLEYERLYIIYSKKYVFIHSLFLIYVAKNNDEFANIRENVIKKNDLLNNKFILKNYPNIPIYINYFIKKYLEKDI